jgi:hypothetical protein
MGITEISQILVLFVHKVSQRTQNIMTTESQSQSPIAEGILSEMAVALSLPCSRCGYDLRGLVADGDCPECGEPIRLTIIETIDPASRRLTPMQNPKRVGNSVTGVVASFFVSCLLAALAIMANAPDALSVPAFVKTLPKQAIVLASVGFGLLALVLLLPMFVMCKRKELVGCRGGLSLTSMGILLWSISMVLVALFVLGQNIQTPAITMLFDTCLPVVSAGIVFSGFKKLVPRLGLRSRAFRQAQWSRQRMNDLLSALVFVVIGRTFLVVSSADSNMAVLGLIIMVMSVSLIMIGLAYLTRNTIWIRQALATPPPALTDLLRGT